jgi:YD repeat-containing protein
MTRTGNAEWISATLAAAARSMPSIALALTFRSTTAIAAESYQYDAIGRLTDIAYANGGSFHYTYDANGNLLSVVTSLATAVDDGSPALEFALGPTTPNPGSGPRRMAFAIPADGHVTLRVFDVSGREVATLYDRVLDRGRYSAQFSTDRWGNGVYFYRLEMGGHVRSGRLVVLR